MGKTKQGRGREWPGEEKTFNFKYSDQGRFHWEGEFWTKPWKRWGRSPCMSGGKSDSRGDTHRCEVSEAAGCQDAAQHRSCAEPWVSLGHRDWPLGSTTPMSDPRPTRWKPQCLPWPGLGSHLPHPVFAISYWWHGWALKQECEYQAALSESPLPQLFYLNDNF